MVEREFDVILYGASGFTGRQTVAYFREHAPTGLRWAIAGRNEKKLRSVAAELMPEQPPEVIVADEGLEYHALNSSNEITPSWFVSASSKHCLAVMAASATGLTPIDSRVSGEVS